MKNVKIKNANFEDAIKVIKADKSRYGDNGEIPITTEFEKGYVKGLEGAILILQETQRTARIMEGE
ncbi:hypothetical protein RQW99_07480 [Leuconostoc falkenbergense]|uniref:hypothetical protein n=1 Tax=Leuconostoc falkenbergense TaxID=2766470 RepID=UPI002A82D141|nr:hypothetical protein [Leuconostoc falkenbergense]MDY5164372.1 hypothetical protein [Leuconostoc falkenbergense]